VDTTEHTEANGNGGGRRGPQGEGRLDEPAEVLVDALRRLFGARSDVEVRSIELSRHGLLNVSHTFHGRDVFAVIAGRLAARKLSFGDVGPLAQLRVPSPIPGVISEADGFVGNVLTVDNFGNLLTSLRASEVLPATDAPFRLQIAGQTLRSVRTFADALPGELVALVGSFDTIEVAVRDGSAAQRLAPVPGANVKLFPS
jgi:S-adenosylmethionine hydrolase